jgi:hypothetical protein
MEKRTPTLTIPAAELKAGMTLLQDNQRLVIDRIRVERTRVMVTTGIGDVPIERDEEVEVRAVQGKPHYTHMSVLH